MGPTTIVQSQKPSASRARVEALDVEARSSDASGPYFAAVCAAPPSTSTTVHLPSRT